MTHAHMGREVLVEVRAGDTWTTAYSGPEAGLIEFITIIPDGTPDRVRTTYINGDCRYGPYVTRVEAIISETFAHDVDISHDRSHG